MQRTKRLFYVPGLISLLGLCILLLSFYKKNMPVKEYGLPLFVPSDKPDKGFNEYSFSKYRLEKDIRKKKKINFKLDENKNENYKKMELIRYEALKLKYTEDTTTVILIAFTEDMSYGDFVSVVNMCEYDSHKRFASWDNKFVIFGEWPKIKREITNSLESFSCGYIQLKKPSPRYNWFELLKKKITTLYTPQGLYLLIGFLLTLISFIFLRIQPIKTLLSILIRQAKR